MFFLWPSIAIKREFWLSLLDPVFSAPSSHTQAPPYLPQELNQLLIIALLAYVGGIWSNARKADAQFAIGREVDASAGREEDRFPAKNPWAALNGFYVFALSLLWFVVWWAMAMWGRMPAITDVCAWLAWSHPDPCSTAFSRNPSASITFNTVAELRIPWPRSARDRAIYAKAPYRWPPSPCHVCARHPRVPLR